MYKYLGNPENRFEYFEIFTLTKFGIFTKDETIKICGIIPPDKGKIRVVT